MAPKFKFADGEKVLCFHGPLLYEAKCIKAQVKDKIVKYYIHYSGWNKNWDEWVPESRVLKYNDANMQKQKELAAAHCTGKKAKPAKGGSKKEPSDREASVLPPQEKTPKQKSKEVAPAPSTSTTETPTDAQRKKRTRAEQNVETEEEFTQKLEIRIKMPDELKHWIVDDWDLVTRQKKLYKLPARVPVETILSDYVKHRLSIKGITPNKESAVNETINGIREYFNVMLGKQLLYKHERAQYAEVMSQNPDATPVQIYGAFHLLRLFTKIGQALAYTPLDEDSINLLTSNLFDFLKYVSKCSPWLLSLSDYEFAPAEGVKKCNKKEQEYENTPTQNVKKYKKERDYENTPTESVKKFKKERDNENTPTESVKKFKKERDNENTPTESVKKFKKERDNENTPTESVKKFKKERDHESTPTEGVKKCKKE